MKAILKHKKKRHPVLNLLLVFFVIVLLSILWYEAKIISDEKTDKQKLVLNEILPAPQCTVNSGFYNSMINISLSSSQPNAIIYFTLDGTEPDENSNIYNSSIPVHNNDNRSSMLSEIPTSPRWSHPLDKVFKGIVIRAIAVTGKMKSPELIRTFFISSQGKRRYTLPIIAITADPEDLFGFKKGIYVMGKNYEQKKNYIKKKIPLNLPWWRYPSNYLKRGDNSERPVHIEFFDSTLNFCFEINAGIRINGNATRGFSQKSLRLIFDEKYDDGFLTYPLFPETNVSKFKTLILSNGGNDWTKTMFRNSLTQTLMKQTNVSVQAMQPCIVFINGEYWGVHQLSERYDEYYFSEHYSLDPEKVTLVEIVNGSLAGNKNEVKAFQDLISFAKNNNLAVDSNYSFLEKRMDIKSFMDVIIANVFICNGDWPDNNVKFWRYKAPADSSHSGMKDGRWRWLIYDTDWGFGYNSPESVRLNLFSKLEKSRTIGVIFDKLLANKNFRQDFYQRFQHMLDRELSSEQVLTEINRMETVLSPEMKEQISRWRVIGSFSDWKRNVKDLKQFAEKRPGIQKQHLKELIHRYE